MSKGITGVSLLMCTKCSFVALCAAVLYITVLSSTLWAASQGEWDIGGKVAAVKTADGYGVKTGIKCEYRISTMLTWRTDVDALLHGVNDLSRVDVSIPSNVLWYPMSSRYAFDPYVGPGLIFVHIWNNRNSLGVNVLAGVNFRIVRDKLFGVEIKYSVPLIPKASSGNFEFGLTGSWEIEF